MNKMHPFQAYTQNVSYTVEPGYNDVGYNDISPIESDFLWYQLILHR